MRARVHQSPPILLSLGGKERGIEPMGECLACGHLMPLAVWKDAPLGNVTHGICAPCRDAAQHLRGDCSSERGCWCAQMGEQAARRERELRDEERHGRIAVARLEARHAPDCRFPYGDVCTCGRGADQDRPV